MKQGHSYHILFLDAFGFLNSKKYFLKPLDKQSKVCYTKYTIKEDEWLVSLKTTQLPNDNGCVSLDANECNEQATSTSYIVYICCITRVK